MKKHEEQPKSASVSNLLFRLWLLFLTFIAFILLTFPSLTNLRIQSYYSQNYADIFPLLEFYLNNISDADTQELFDRIYTVSGISIKVEKYDSLKKSDNISSKFISSKMQILDTNLKSARLEYISYANKRRISIFLDSPLKQYTIAVMYLIVSISAEYGYQDRNLMWQMWHDKFKINFNVLSKPPKHISLFEKQNLEDNKFIWILDKMNQISVIYKYDKSTYLIYGNLKAFEKYPLILMLCIVIAGALFVAIGLSLIVKKINKDLFLIYLSATRIFRGYANVNLPKNDKSLLNSINEIFEDGNAKLEKARKEQQDLVAAVSHELRTPLARLLFSIQMIEDTKDINSIKKHTKSMEDDVGELNTMVDEILTYNKLDKTGIKLKLEKVCLKEISQTVINNLYMLPNHVEVDLLIKHREEESKIIADAVYIQRGIHNLVSNANRYAKSKIILILDYSSDEVLISVEDDGIGIPESERQDVFSPFVRLDNSRNRNSGGYGLGLSIVSKVVAWHKAEVWVTQSDRLSGAKFCIRIAKDLRNLPEFQNPNGA